MELAKESKTRPHIDSLRRIRSLSRFGDAQLAELAERLVVETAAPRECLVERGCTEAFSLYLIDGALEAVAPDDKVTRYESRADGELPPIAQIRPSMYQVIADGPARILKIDASLLTDFAQRQDTAAPAGAMDVIELDQTGEVNELTVQLFQDLLAGNLKLPSLPDVARRIQQAFAEDSVDAEQIAALIQSDPAITAKLIMVANSALYGGQAPIETLQQAVVRLGLETTRKQVLVYAVKELFQSRNPTMQRLMQDLWKHSQQVACLSRLLAGQLDGFDLEQAQLAGLIHDLGSVALLNYAQQDDALCADHRQLLDAVERLRPQITGMLLNQWNFGPEFVTVGEECENWFRNPSEQADLCDLVLIAQYHALLGTPEQQRLPPVSTLPAFAKLGMGDIDVQQIVEFLKHSREELDAIAAHLAAI